MIKKILLATDGSRHAYGAAMKTVELAKQLGDVAVTLYHVSENIPSRSTLIQAQFDIRSVLEEEAHQAIMQTERLFEQEKVTYELSVALGEPAEEIIKKANEEAYDLLIVGSRGLNKLQELVLGSVSNRIAHEASCPVMIVK